MLINQSIFKVVFTSVFISASIAMVMMIASLCELNNIPSHGVSADVEPYVQRFLKVGKQIRGDNFTIPVMDIGIGDMRYMPITQARDRIAVGLCNDDLEPINIILDQTYWIDATDLEREQLVFHELGHGVLHREHNDNTVKDIPLSIMHSTVMDDETYSAHRNEYILELFIKDDNVVRMSIAQ